MISLINGSPLVPNFGNEQFCTSLNGFLEELTLEQVLTGCSFILSQDEYNTLSSQGATMWYHWLGLINLITKDLQIHLHNFNYVFEIVNNENDFTHPRLTCSRPDGRVAMYISPMEVFSVSSIQPQRAMVFEHVQTAEQTGLTTHSVIISTVQEFLNQWTGSCVGFTPSVVGNFTNIKMTKKLSNKLCCTFNVGFDNNYVSIVARR